MTKITFNLTDEDSDITSFLNNAQRTSGLSRTNIIKQALRSYARDVASNGRMTFYVDPEVFSNSVRGAVVDEKADDESTTQTKSSQNAPDSTSDSEQSSEVKTDKPEEQKAKATKADPAVVQRILNGGIQTKSSNDIHY